MKLAENTGSKSLTKPQLTFNILKKINVLLMFNNYVYSKTNVTFFNGQHL